MKKAVLALALLAPLSLGAETFRRTFRTAADWDRTLYDGKIDVSDPAGVRLLKTELIADEMGMTTGKMDEVVIGNTWIRKDFLLEQVQADAAVLLIHWNEYESEPMKRLRPALDVEVNGRPIRLIPDVERMRTGGWIRCDVPVAALRAGLNSVIIHNATDFPFVFSVEAAKFPNRSAKSLDGGRSWDDARLGRGNYIDGEYLIRLRLSRYPARAEILSDFIELAGLAGEGAVKPAVVAKSLRLAAQAEKPAGTGVLLAVRGGPTPAFDPATWSGWVDPARLGPADLKTWKFVQWRAELRTTDRRLTPVLASLELAADLAIAAPVPPGLRVEREENRRIVRGYYPFAFQDAAEPRLATLRNRYRMEEVVGGCTTEFQKFRTLAFWVRGMWRDAWGEHGEELHTPWDALVALELAPEYKASGMCVIYGNTFVQSALSVGLQARGLILDHHFASEAWSNELGKWVMFDIGNNTTSLRPAFHEKDGVPLDAREIHELARADRLDEIWVVPAGPQDRFKGSEDVKQGGHYLGPRYWKPRFGIPLRNNHLTSWLPGELEHGFIQYHYDGYLWWKDTPIPEYEEYTLHSSHDRDFHFTLHEAQVFLQAAEDAAKLEVVLDTVTPNFKTFEVRLDGGEWAASPAAFAWPLRAGANTLEARSVDVFGLAGPVSRITVAR